MKWEFDYGTGEIRGPEGVVVQVTGGVKSTFCADCDEEVICEDGLLTPAQIDDIKRLADAANRGLEYHADS